MKSIFIFFIAFSLCANSFAQDSRQDEDKQHIIDSLNKVITAVEIKCPEPCPADTGRISAYLLWGEQIYLNMPDSALILWNNAFDLSNNLIATIPETDPVAYTTKKYLAKTLNNIGYIYKIQGNTSEALEYFQKSLNIQEEIGDRVGMSSSFNNIAYIYQQQGNISEALEYFDKCIKIKEEYGDKQGMATPFNNIASIYQMQGDISKALEYFHKSLKLREDIGDEYGMAMSFNNIGMVYSELGDIIKALEYFHKSLMLREKIDDKRGTASSLNNIGLIYNNQGDNSKALEYYQKSLKLREEIKDRDGMANSFHNIATIYSLQGDIPKALEYYDKSLKILEEIGDKKGMANSFNSIGAVYNNQASLAQLRDDNVASDSLIGKAVEYYQKSLEIREEIGDKKGMANSFYSLGRVSHQQNDVLQLNKYANKAYKLSIELGFPENIEQAASLMKDLNVLQGNYKKAFEYYSEEIAMRDSILNEENYKQTLKEQAKYEYNKQQAVDSVAYAKAIQIKNIEIKNQETKLEAGKKLRQTVIIIAVLSLLLVFLFFNRYLLRIRQKQNKLKISNLENAQKLLHAQMNPHFLFNSLNSIQGFIIDNKPKLAREYLVKFSRIMRSVLEQTSKNSHPLRDEIEILELYLDLEQVRLNHKFTYEITVPNSNIMGGVALPTLLIQPFVENAVLHGIRHKEENGKISIEFIKKDNILICTVEDNGIGREQAGLINAKKMNQHTSMAMKLVKARLDHMSAGRKKDAGFDIIDIYDDLGKSLGTKILIKIPLIHFSDD